MKPTSSFADSVDASTKRHGPGCCIGKILAGSDPKWAAEVVAVMADKTQTHAAIRRALQKPENGSHRVPEGAVDRHRNRDCGCVVR